LTLPWQPLFDWRFFQKVNSLLFNKKNYNFLEVAFTFLDQFPVLLLILMTFWGKSGAFGGFGK